MHQLHSSQSVPSGGQVWRPGAVSTKCSPACEAPSSTAAGGRRTIGSWMLLLLLRMYVVLLSPFLGGACKFYPSCSNYAREAIERHGARRGTLLALKRLLRCHPFTRGGIDLVPDELPGVLLAAHSIQSGLAASDRGKSW